MRSELGSSVDRYAIKLLRRWSGGPAVGSICSPWMALSAADGGSVEGSSSRSGSGGVMRGLLVTLRRMRRRMALSGGRT